MTQPHSRRKRDSVDNLYRQCVLGADCPDDVRNKVEGNTIADKILKWVAGFLYTGTLGIGTGRGTGGMGGYVPIGRGGGVTQGAGGTRVIRPSGPIEPIGPFRPTVIDSTPSVEIGPRPIDPSVDVRPTDPSVFEPGPHPDLPAVGEEIELETFNGEESVLTDTNPTADLPPTGAPTIDVTETSFVEVRPNESRTSTITTTNLDNAAYTAAIAETAGEADQYSIMFDSSVGGTLVGEEYELDTFSPDFEEIPLTSTPETRPEVRQKGRRFTFYHRFFRQMQLPSTSFTRPEIGGNYVFENPAFDRNLLTEDNGEPITTEVREQVQTRNLGEVAFAKRPEGRLRVSRMGRQPGMTTRSGEEYGQHIHLFADISTIVEADIGESIELHTLTTSSSDAVGPLDPITISSDTDFTTEHGGIQEVDLETYEPEETFANSRLRLIDAEEINDEYDIGEIESPKKVYAVSTVNQDRNSQVPVRKPVYINPGDIVVVSYNYEDFSNYSLFDPSLYKKRKWAFIF